ncbi:phage holin family protein [Phosphitispora fastidiosa]|uniref:phage holin family protein n=1 Tax=Phosphitispora fastidiosa TaxID=2837202 RepID=UPI001E2CD691|nr:phage holin family protein [Phosphitispora fastidiosa]MBU7006274.1 putative membrane protein [Phosphitispora fastidiosa]
MRGLIIRWVLNALALLATAWLMPGIGLDGFGAALITALVLGIVNAIIRPVILFFTLPLTIVTLGLFTLVINAVMLLITASAVDGFSVSGFWAAFFGSIIITIISGVLSRAVIDDNNGKKRNR